VAAALCPRALCPRALCPRALCPRALCPRALRPRRRRPRRPGPPRALIAVVVVVELAATAATVVMSAEAPRVRLSGRWQFWTGHTYEFTVGAASAGGFGPVAVRLRPPPPLPAAPTDVRAVAGDGAVTSTWAGPAPQYFSYHRDVTRGEELRRFPLPDSVGLPFQDAFLINGDTNEYQVSASNIASEGSSSTVVSARPVGA
jgi:hypothetical protein